jgi:hypothetical protein
MGSAPQLSTAVKGFLSTQQLTVFQHVSGARCVGGFIAGGWGVEIRGLGSGGRLAAE